MLLPLTIANKQSIVLFMQSPAICISILNVLCVCGMTAMSTRGISSIAGKSMNCAQPRFYPAGQRRHFAGFYVGIVVNMKTKLLY